MASVPIIEFSPEAIAAIKADLQLPMDEVIPNEDGTPHVALPPPVKRRGRKPNVIRDDAELTPVSDAPLPPAPLTKRDEREVNSRLTNMLLGGTGILANVRPYLGMTEEEAKAIAEPLSSYLVRNADVMPVARQVLENYDLAAITIGVASYAARVYSDRREEVAAERSSNVTPFDRVLAFAGTDQEAPEIRPTGFISNANAESGGRGL